MACAAGGVSTYALPSGAQTPTPTTGHTHMLFVRVDFPDTTFSDYEDAETLQATIGTGIEGVNGASRLAGHAPRRSRGS